MKTQRTIPNRPFTQKLSGAVSLGPHGPFSIQTHGLNTTCRQNCSITFESVAHCLTAESVSSITGIGCPVLGLLERDVTIGTFNQMCTFPGALYEGQWALFGKAMDPEAE